LVGGSVALGLRGRGWHVQGTDVDGARVTEALERKVIDAAGLDPDSEITFVAVPVRAVAEAARRALQHTTGLVTDVASVKGPVVVAVDSPRFIGGHPMAGSELEGLDGADPDMFTGAVWVVTPTPATDDASLATLAAIVSDLGAEMVALTAERHDALVAVVSHVPHLTAATLMRVADERATEHAALLRLAAGGFRDMTRIASGHPAIWPDICFENQSAIVTGLDALIEGLGEMRTAVAQADRTQLLRYLEQARAGRANLPARGVRAEMLSEVRIPIPDRPGMIAEVTMLAAELGVNLSDIEVAHSAEGDRGVLILLVETERTELFRGGLLARGYRPAISRLQ
jgi:prephenate dehydrogenase